MRMLALLSLLLLQIFRGNAEITGITITRTSSNSITYKMEGNLEKNTLYLCELNTNDGTTVRKFQVQSTAENSLKNLPMNTDFTFFLHKKPHDGKKTLLTQSATTHTRLLCMVCTGAAKNEDCKKISMCEEGERYCETNVQYVPGNENPLRINKKCKKQTMCANNPARALDRKRIFKPKDQMNLKDFLQALPAMRYFRNVDLMFRQNTALKELAIKKCLEQQVLQYENLFHQRCSGPDSIGNDFCRCCCQTDRCNHGFMDCETPKAPPELERRAGEEVLDVSPLIGSRKDPSTACTYRNGGCSHICTVVNGEASCTCLHKYVLAEDKKTCNAIRLGARANAGPDITVKMPTKSVTISGEGTTGEVKAFYWWSPQAIRRSPLRIPNPNSKVIEVSNLRPGKYQFMLRVIGKDNKPTTDSMVLTVLPASDIVVIPKRGTTIPVVTEQPIERPQANGNSIGQRTFNSLEERERWIEWNKRTSSTPLPTTHIATSTRNRDKKFRVVEVKLGPNGREYITTEGTTKPPTTTKKPKPITAAASTTPAIGPRVLIRRKTTPAPTTKAPRTTTKALSTTKPEEISVTRKPRKTTVAPTTSTTVATTTPRPPDSCPNVELETFQGSLKCTGSEHGLSCTVSCDAGRVLAGGDETINCNNGTWSGRLACCDLPCPPFAVLDLVLVIDSMPTASDEDFNILLNYTMKLLTTYKVSRSGIKIGILSMNGNSVTTIWQFGRAIDSVKLKEILVKFGSQPRVPGRTIGAAMKYLNVITFRQLPNRPKVEDMAIIFTDGKSSDDVKPISKKMSVTNIKIKVVGIVNDNEPEEGQIDIEELLHVASTPDDLILLKNGFNDITAGALEGIFKSDFCPKACSTYESNNVVCDGEDCECKRGFVKKSATAFMCTDNNECRDGSAECVEHSKCINTFGSYECECVEGWEGNGKQECTDKDECLGSPCSSREMCVNALGSYKCICAEGYKRSKGRCIDVNECRLNKHDCPATAKCQNTIGSFACACKDGYHGTGYYCKDVNECLQGLHNCHPRAHCTNEDGSFQCACKDGFTGNGEFCTDIDECLNDEACPRDSDCSNTFGSFRCKCKDGYMGQAGNCKDVDECNNSPCEHTCENIPGSFKCDCNKGFTLSTDGTSCVDFNECAIDNGGCPVACINEVGSHRCENDCFIGYTKVPGSEFCTDMDECKSGQHTCHEEASCKNVYGSFLCTCNSGYEGNGQNCTDVDECKTGVAECELGCTNTIGGFYCECDPGYLYDTETQSCEDVNECKTGDFTCPENTKCLNKIGSYACGCLQGYIREGGDCTDVDECSLDDTCGPNQRCRNIPGSFYCVCQTGYSTIDEVCVDLNECDSGLDNCDPTSTRCVNTIGSFTCLCKRGYTRDGAKCSDINECKFKDPICGENSVCNNTIGSFVCGCLSGFQLVDGVCKDINECLTDNGQCLEQCINTMGSYRCNCPEGYQLSEDKRSCQPGCSSISELERRRIRARCTDGSYLGSKCKFFCPKGLLLKEGVPSAICSADNEGATPEWTTFTNTTMPCCDGRCPPHAFVDLMFVLDASHTVQAENWATMVDFVIAMMGRYKITSTGMCFGAFRFNEEVDSKSEIKLSCNRKKGITKKMLFRMPYSGQGSSPKKALSHLIKSSFATEINRPSAPDVAIVLTDGSSNENITKEMKMIKNSGIKLHVVGIRNLKSQSNSTLWKEMAQNNEDNLTMLNSGFEALAQELEERLFGVICSQPCAQYSEKSFISQEIERKIEIRLKRRGNGNNPS